MSKHQILERWRIGLNEKKNKYRKEYEGIIKSAEVSTMTAERLRKILNRFGYTSLVVQHPRLLTDKECKKIVDVFYVKKTKR